MTMKKRKKPWHGYTVIYNSAYFKSIQCGMQKIPKAYHHTNITFNDYIFSPSSIKMIKSFCNRKFLAHTFTVIYHHLNEKETKNTHL